MGQMFDLVNDIASYPEFLSWCVASRVIERTESTVVAALTIDFKGIKKTFTTRNTLFRDTKMRMELVEGPFSVLTGEWLFSSLDGRACRVALQLDFEFSSRLMGKILSPVFSKIANSMVNDFCKRADDLYNGDGHGQD